MRTSKGLSRVRLFACECFTRNAGVPVHERAARVVLPRPDMQCIERRKAEAIGRIEKMKQLPHKLGWTGTGVHGVPRVDQNQVVCAGKAYASVGGGLVEDDLGMRGVYHA